MKKSCFFIVLAFFLLSLISCDDDNITKPKLGKVIIDTTINVNLNDVSVTTEQGVTITIPKGLSSEDFKLVIREVDNPPPTPNIMKLHNVYDIELSIGEEFSKEITIRFDINPSILADKIESDFGFGFYNTREKKWNIFPNYTVNLNEHYIECKTNHLTTLGFLEFITSGGYSYKFVGDGVTVYYASGKNSPMSWSDYMPSDQPWHIPSGDKNWAFEYIQDIAYYTAEARKILSESPHNLNVSKGNINIYVTDLKGNDGEYGSVSGAIYINNKMKLPNHVSGVALEDVLKATCAHELMHLIQDNYYVMNKGSIGLWWLEATATQADRMVYGDDLLYSESELYTIESNAALLENLSKSWDDCNKDPNWYLAGSFLQYMSHYREGEKLNIANSIKLGGSGLSLMRVILNDQINSELGSNIWDEYVSYVLYLFTEGNEKLSAFPYNKDFSAIETATGLTKQVKMSKKDNTQSIKVDLPYLATKLISIGNIENDEILINYNTNEINAGLEAFLCEVDKTAGKLKVIDQIYKGKQGDISLKGRVGGDVDNFVILLINTGFTEGSKKEASFTFKTSVEFKQFTYMRFRLEGDDKSFNYTNGNKDSEWEIGFSNLNTNLEYSTISKSFSGNKIKLILEQKGDYSPDNQYSDFISRLTIEGEYSSSEFIILKLREEITKFDEVWSDTKNTWVKHKIEELKEFEYEKTPFNIQDNPYNYVYTHNEFEKDKIKSKLKKINHKVLEYDDENKVKNQYELLPLNWNNLPFYFSLSMITWK